MLPPPLKQIDRTFVLLGRKRLIYFGGCDYFRLASHPRILRAVATGIKEKGLNVAASRATTGNHPSYALLEARLARFFNVPAALLLANGYATNLVVAQALAGRFSHVLIDERAHPSLQDAATYFGCPVIGFKHLDATDVTRASTRIGRDARVMLLTDGMFANDGAVAPLADYRRALGPSGWLLVDDAHAAGVLGGRGQGSLEHAGVGRTRVVQTVTLSKAFGVYGGAILAGKSLIQTCVAQSRLFIGSTPLPPPLVEGILAAISLLRNDRSMRTRLRRNMDYLRRKLSILDIPNHLGASPILAIYPRSRKQSASLKLALLQNGVYPSWIHYPGGPDSGYFRFALSSEHTFDQLDRLVRALTVVQ